MQFTYLAVPLFAALAAAQSSNSTSLPDLVAQLPTCALDCLESGAKSANCTVTDFTCLCGTGKQQFIQGAGVCVLTSSCTSEEKNNVSNLATEICNDVSDGASSSEIASASAVATSILASATSTTGSNAAAATAVGYGLMGGAAALAAFAL
ncbi:hypothetical protein BKA67DRAFT_659875 [Truncatella angustata]|uniref:CFEM domain-containing protein n=1 Tax=Truncatella angustata TaxID=152316 RepID=A0A9P8UJF3_9PEZI|nr:uncharacterized protein BKA67DRAFT_659875 [Truncatella angustata]KAH6653242.1 hypothetical protein BKA67DRAFT_659875 [Truncatella angustata]KAH8204780.1 hypothetical protein TruAng_001114 [Truncatella angustata]